MNKFSDQLKKLIADLNFVRLKYMQNENEQLAQKEKNVKTILEFSYIFYLPHHICWHDCKQISKTEQLNG